MHKNKSNDRPYFFQIKEFPRDLCLRAVVWKLSMRLHRIGKLSRRLSALVWTLNDRNQNVIANFAGPVHSRANNFFCKVKFPRYQHGPLFSGHFFWLLTHRWGPVPSQKSVESRCMRNGCIHMEKLANKDKKYSHLLHPIWIYHRHETRLRVRFTF